MARSRDELRAARAAILLRCQTAREAARRIDALRAATDRDAARGREQERRGVLAEGVMQAEREVAIVAVALQAGALDPLSLDALVTREVAARSLVRRLDQDVEVASAAVASAEARLDAANAVLTAERRATRKRQRLAELTADVRRRTIDAAQETDREDQVADMWRSA